MGVKLIDLLILFRKVRKNIRYLCVDKINKKRSNDKDSGVSGYVAG